ncbi:hypothetical protein [Rhodococcus sp. NPDC057529]|uniref:hypothetical protein n=1 Tax=Rhodococcus sp. NPDC057529 TaxID=3346158 RepID=UPI00366F08BD
MSARASSSDPAVIVRDISMAVRSTAIRGHTGRVADAGKETPTTSCGGLLHLRVVALSVAAPLEPE